jgi:hypothetical protein
MGDVCYYGENDLNKNGKIGATSWDSFSYCADDGTQCRRIRSGRYRVANDLNDIEA